jgi:hypothetical protein
MKLIVLAVWLPVALNAQEGQLRFRVEPLRAKPASVKPADFGMVNRVRYRVAPGAAMLTVEREKVSAPDPQGGTRARPAPDAAGAWTPETLDAAAGTRALAWGDFDNDGSEELLTGWPAAVWKHMPSGRWQRVGSVPEMKACDSVAAVDIDSDGLADIVCTTGNSGTVARNETPLHWIRHVIATGFRNQSAAPGDFAGHGLVDVISGDIENDHKIRLFSAPDWKPMLLRTGIRVIQSLGLDVNGDGRLDYIGAQYSVSPVRI